MYDMDDRSLEVGLLTVCPQNSGVFSRCGLQLGRMWRVLVLEHYVRTYGLIDAHPQTMGVRLYTYTTILHSYGRDFKSSSYHNGLIPHKPSRNRPSKEDRYWPYSPGNTFIPYIKRRGTLSTGVGRPTYLWHMSPDDPV